VRELVIPTCFGCGAMARRGTCANGCREQRLGVVRAAAVEQIIGLRASLQPQLAALRAAAAAFASSETPSADLAAAYRRHQAEARAVLRRFPEIDAGWLDEPAEPAEVWWCAACDAVDAPQPCLDVCIWRPVAWVPLAEYAHERQSALEERAAVQRVRATVRLLAFTTPRAGHWEKAWESLRARADRAAARAG
jgi:hypothetical protein